MIAGLVLPARADVAVWLECRPALPFYCANIHVGCAGRSNLPTEPFTLAYASAGMIHRDGKPPRVVSVRSSATGTVFRPVDTRDWIRVETAGKPDDFAYSQRIYRNGKALMARGICRHAPRDIRLPRPLSP